MVHFALERSEFRCAELWLLFRCVLIFPHKTTELFKSSCGSLGSNELEEAEPLEEELLLKTRQFPFIYSIGLF